MDEKLCMICNSKHDYSEVVEDGGTDYMCEACEKQCRISPDADFQYRGETTLDDPTE